MLNMIYEITCLLYLNKLCALLFQKCKNTLFLIRFMTNLPIKNLQHHVMER